MAGSTEIRIGLTFQQISVGQAILVLWIMSSGTQHFKIAFIEQVIYENTRQ